MSGLIPREFIDDLLVRVDIVDLIDSHHPLKKTGANYSARCPFHTEKTPSFSVNRSKQFYHCFGCGASGNAISFLMDFNHLDFIEAVEDLASFVGVEVPRETIAKVTASQKDDVNALYLLMEQVAGFYIEQLRKTPIAIDYLKNRGVKAETARDFMIGYAPDEWNALTDHFSKTSLIDVGLLVSKEDGKTYDRFRHRVMFPIRDRRGRIVGFGGRVLDDSLPKYLNSPETSLFHKGKEVYGLYELLKKNSKPSRIVIVEGYMDVIALAQYGIDYAVAALGTAASQAHLELLFRFSSELVFCFDGDKAGQDAAWRVMDGVFSSLKDGRQVRIMLLPQAHDPDSLIREEGLEKFTSRIQSAEALSDYFFNILSKKLNLNEKEGRAALVNKAKSYLEKLPNGVFRDLMFKELSRLAALEIINNEIPVRPKQVSQQVSSRLSPARDAIALLIQYPELVGKIEQLEIDWQDFQFNGSNLLKKIIQTIELHHPANTGMLLELFRDTPEETKIKNLANFETNTDPGKIEQVFCDAIKTLLARADENLITLSLSSASTEDELKDIAKQITRVKSKKI